MSIECFAVPPWEARRVGLFCKYLIEKACSRNVDQNFDTPEHLISDAENGLAILWVARDDSTPIGVLFTRRVVLDDGRIAISIPVCGGHRFKDWGFPMREKIHAFRKAEGAKVIAVSGRKGWGRVFNTAPLGQDAEGRWIFEE